jgi:pimeloyl-ACP methyl ester carboxylesterase
LTDAPAAGPPPREGLTFRSGDAVCAAWLYRPAGAGPHPVVVMAHGLGATREMRLAAYAERFRAAGYACLVFDYRHFGDSGGEPRQLIDVNSQLEDWRSALAFVRDREDLDRDRIALWGTSFGGGHALAVGARDPAVAAVVAQCPFTDGIASALALDPRSSAKVTPLAVRDLLAARRGRPPVYVDVVGPPGSRALMTAPDAEPGVEALVEGVAGYENRACARIGLQVLGYRPGRRAARIAAPVLLCVCERDSVAPARAALRHARRIPRAEVRLYPEGHFDVYFGAPFERAVADQLEFLARHVPAAAG